VLSRSSHGQWIVLIILGMASRVFACPVCWVGRDGTTSAYLLTAVLMCTVLLIIFGGMVYYVSRQAKHEGATGHEWDG
jgi:hypothetical protein